MLFSEKENVFMCLVAFQKMFRKIFSDVWLCSWKYHRKHIFYLLLTFSQLPNEYIISFISQNTNKTKKKIIKSGQTIGEIAIGVVGASHDRNRTKLRSRSARSRDASIARRSTHRAKIEASITIAIGATVAAGDVGGRWCRDRFFLSPSLSLSLSLSSIFQGRK